MRPVAATVCTTDSFLATNYFVKNNCPTAIVWRLINVGLQLIKFFRFQSKYILPAVFDPGRPVSLTFSFSCNFFLYSIIQEGF